MDSRMARLALSIAPTIRSANSSVVSGAAPGFSFSVVMSPPTVLESDQFNRPFRQAHPVAVDDLSRRLPGITRGPERDEQRGEMLDGRVRVWHARRLVSKVDERVDITSGEALADPAVELGGPVRRGGSWRRVVEKRQTVGGETGADD